MRPGTGLSAWQAWPQLRATRRQQLWVVPDKGLERPSGQMLEASWLRRNPFELLSWPSEDYCGELSEGELPQRGCWHYLPARGWLLHRSRFTDAGQGMDGQLQVFQLRAVPQLSSTGPQSPGRFISMELDRVPAAEVAALAQAYR